MTDFPPPHDAAGLDRNALAAAIRHAGEHITPWGRDLATAVTNDFGEPPPWHEALGPVRPRGGPNGLVLRGGCTVAEWGDTTRSGGGVVGQAGSH